MLKNVFIAIGFCLLSACWPSSEVGLNQTDPRGLTGTPSPSGSRASSDQVLQAWQQTDYVFYNKTGNEIRIVDVFSTPENIQSILLQTGECAYIENSVLFDENSGKLICGNALSDVNNQEGDCAFKISEEERRTLLSAIRKALCIIWSSIM